MTYPTAAPERAEHRAAMTAKAQQQAERESRLSGRTMMCRGGLSWPARHHPDPDGCKSDGTTCLCTCHDDQANPTPNGAL